MNMLEVNKNGQLTISSIKEYLSKESGETRWCAFMELINDPEYEMSYGTFYKTLCIAYQESDRLNVDEAAQLFGEFEGEGWYKYSTKKVQKFYDALPQELTIYRGCTRKEAESGEYGISWTTDKKVAEFFAHKYLRRDTDNGVVLEATIYKNDICGLLLDRNESEVIIPFAEDTCWNAKEV